MPKKHLLPVDRTVHGAEPGTPLVRTVVHLHGGHVPPESDGYPEAWFARKFAKTGPYFTTKIYYYPNVQQAATLWYHDHALGITRLNVYAGLAGFYILRDDCEDRLNLPAGKYEIPLVIQDRSFNPDGSLFYPRQPEKPVPDVDPSVVPEFFGDTILVNGKVWPYLEVEPRKYRFRLLNGSNSRFYRLKLSSGQPIFQIGTDGGLLEAPVKLKTLLLSPGERADVIIDFAKLTGRHILLTNDAPAPFPNGTPPDDNTVQIMQFRVVLPLSDNDTGCLPSQLYPLPRLSQRPVHKTRDLSLTESTDKYGRPIMLLNGLRWDDPITEKPELGTTEIWRLINETPDSHPIHLHMVQFHILDRQPFDVKHYSTTGKLRFTGPAVRPHPNERGWKDTVSANPGQVTRIITRFTDFTGLYVWHCHILEHEDYEMMRPYQVMPTSCPPPYGHNAGPIPGGE